MFLISILAQYLAFFFVNLGTNIFLNMKRFIITCCFLPLISISQQLEAFLSSATFSLSQGGNYLETYLFFDANTVNLINSGDEIYYGSIKTNIKLVEKKKVIYEDGYILTSPDFSKQKYKWMTFC